MRPSLPSPDQRETIRQFLAESTSLHVDHVEFTRPESGVALTIHYRDARGFPHKKSIQSPDARTDQHIVELTVLASEWLGHPTTAQRDMLETAGNC